MNKRNRKLDIEFVKVLRHKMQHQIQNQTTKTVGLLQPFKALECKRDWKEKGHVTKLAVRRGD